MWDAQTGVIFALKTPSILKEEQNQPINSRQRHEGFMANIQGNSCLLHTPKPPKKRNRKPGGKLKKDG